MTKPPNTDATCEPDPDELARGNLPTDVSRRTAWVVAVAFVVAVASLPLTQTVFDLRRGRPVAALAVFHRAPTKENLHAFEKELAEKSSARKTVQPRLQLALSEGLGYGNGNAVIGRDGWLFYRPGVEFVTGRPLLDATRLRQRRKELAEAGERSPQPDPRPAVLAFHETCRAAGVKLIVVPVPDKAMLQPGELSSRNVVTAATPVTANRDYQRFLAEMRGAGVDIFDPTPDYLKPGEPARFLRQDSHWSPQWMEKVAKDLADHIRCGVTLSAAGRRTYSGTVCTANCVGDIVAMLRLSATQTHYGPEVVEIKQVRDARDRPWRSRGGADVLLLGDSFSNIYTAAEMGWGESGGFAAQLSRELGRDVDALTRNGSGATATRRELARRPDPLAGKRVVIWQFAVRDLTSANWEIVPLQAEPATQTTSPADSAKEVVLDATVLAVSRVPAPFSVPYKDCLTYVKVRVDRVVSGQYDDSEMIAVFWGLRDNVQTAAAGYGPGKKLQLKVLPLRQAALDLTTVRTADDLDDLSRRPFFVTEERGQ